VTPTVTPTPSFVFNGILDAFPSSAMTAYSVSRRLTRNYTGPLIEATFISGGTQYTEDIGYLPNDVSGTINMSRLSTIASGADGGTVYLSKIYDQYDGTSYDFVQTNIVNMPLIATGNTLITLSGASGINRLSSYVSGGTQYMSGATPMVASPQPMTFFMSMGAQSPSGGGLKSIFGNSSTGRVINFTNAGGAQIVFQNVITNNTFVPTANTTSILYVLLDNDMNNTGYLGLNNTTPQTNTGMTSRFSSNVNYLFNANINISGVIVQPFPNSFFQEMIIYSGNQSTNRLSILSGNTYGINTYYGAY
jgi:hypothetical protein